MRGFGGSNIKQNKMTSVKCIKNVKAKKGFEFEAGKSYSYAIHSDGILIYFSPFEFVKIKSLSTFKKFFS